MVREVIVAVEIAGSCTALAMRIAVRLMEAIAAAVTVEAGTE